MPFSEERVACAITQFLFDTAQEPLIATALAGILQYFAVKLQAVVARVGELVCIEKTQEVRELVGVAAVWCRGE